MIQKYYEKIESKLKSFFSETSLRSEIARTFIFGLGFLAIIVFLRDHGIDSAKYVASIPSNVSARMEKNKKDLRNKQMIREAKIITRDAETRACKAISKTRSELVFCLSKIPED